MRGRTDRRLSPRRHPDEGDRGAVLVEAAFVLPIFMVLVFATIEFGLFFAASATTTSATRAGARFGSATFATASSGTTAANTIKDKVTDDIKSLTGQDTALTLWIYKANANGFPGTLSNFSSCPSSCYRYTWTGGAFVLDGSSPGWSNADACIILPNGETLDSIGVYLTVNHRYVTGLLGSNVVIRESTVTQLEPLPLVQCS